MPSALAQAKSLCKFPLALPLLVLGGYMLFAIAVIGLPGNFPLNDDWMYGLEVQKMLETGKLHLYGGSPSCIAHITAGALACKLFGFSFETLRSLCLLTSFAGTLLLYGILRTIRIHRADALLASFVLLSNPLYLNLSFCYMTDVPALAYSLAYVLLVLIAIKRNKPAPIVLASFCLIAAIAVRQNNAVFALANMALAIIIWKRSRIMALLMVLLLMAVPIACAYYIDHMMVFVNLYPGAYDWYKKELARLFALALHKPFAFFFLETVSTVRAGAYLGLFTWPLLAGFLGTSLWLKKTGASARSLRLDVAIYAFIALILTLAAVTFLVAFQHHLMPFSPNLLPFPALGSVTIINDAAKIPTMANVGLTAVAATFACVLLFSVACAVHRTVLLCFKELRRQQKVVSNTQSRSLENHENETFTAIETVAQSPAPTMLEKALSISKSRNRHASQHYVMCALMIMTCGLSFAWSVLHSTIANLDRYFLAPVAFVIPCILLTARWLRVRSTTSVTIFLAAIIALYSTAAQHDYMQWNRMRWQALHDLERRGVQAKEIDGGIEYNYSNDPALNNDLILTANTFENVHRGSAETAQQRWWSIHEERYIISLRQLANYHVAREYHCWSALSLSQQSLFVLERKPISTESTPPSL